MAHSSRVIGRLCGWEAVAECSEGPSEGLVGGRTAVGA
jgi:hypothetical protein